MLTLGIETATDVCAVALLDGERVLVEAALHVPRSHGRRLAPLVAEALAHAGRDATALDRVAVSAGPGSYTGLRIGMGVAKGLALAADAVLVAVPTLDALADGATGENVPLVVALPSRRGEVYAAVYAHAGPVREAAALSLSDADAWLPPGPLALGGPASAALAEAVARPWQRVDLVPSAVSVARLGRQLEPADLDAVEPAYLKPVAASRPRGIFGPPTS